MLYKKQLFVLLCFLFLSLQAQPQKKATHLVKQSFSLPGLGLNIRQRSEIEELIYYILTTNKYQQAQAAKQVAANMQKELNNKKKDFERAHTFDRAIMHHNAGILLTQKRHFEDFARIALHHLSWSDYFTEFFSEIWNKTRCFLKSTKGTSCITPIQALTERLLEYCRLEREYIFNNYTQTQHLMAAQRNKALPQLIKIWEHPSAQFALLKGVKRFASKPQLQEAVVAEAVGEAAIDGGEAVAQVGQAVLLDGGGTIAGATAEEASELAALFEQLDATVAQMNDIADLTELATPAMETTSEATANVASSTIADSIQATTEDIAPDISKQLSGNLTQETASQAGEQIGSEGTETAQAFNALNTSEQDLDQLFNELDQAQEQIESNVDQMHNDQYIKNLKDEVKTRLGNIKDGKIPLESAQNALQQILKDLNTLADDGSPLLSEEAAEPFNAEISDLKQLAKSTLKSSQSAARNAKIMGAVDMARDMALQMDVMMGGQLAVNWVNAADAKEYANLSKQRNDIAASFHANITKMAAARDAKINQIQSNFTAKLLSIANDQNNAVGINSDQKNYLMQALIKTTINQLYINPSVMQLDQFFYNAPMLTPNITQTPLFDNTKAASQSWALPTHSTPIVQQTQKGWLLTNPSPTNPQTSQSWALQPVGSTTNTINNNNISSENSIVVPTILPNNIMPHTWYNLYRNGNWQFDYTTNSFYQYQAVPFISDEYPLGDPQKALYNSIFTNYIPPVILNAQGIETYVIQAEVQIYSALYPCYAGIIFNSGRWVSGVTDLYHQHRLFGIHGTPDKKLQATAGETFYINPSKKLASLDAVWPLSQILADEKQKTVWNALSQNIIKNPLYPNNSKTDASLEIGKTYLLTIATQASKIMLQIEEKGKTPNPILFGPYTIENRNPFVFIYHNIGFISAGCSARFTLLQPKQLVYDSAILQSFSNSLSSSEEK